MVSSQAYVELNELKGNTWQETSRWVGYEENFNPTTGKWGPSHVSYLNFKSLIQLRRTMSTGDLRAEDALVVRMIRPAEHESNTWCHVFLGAFIFDLSASSLSAVAENVADELVNNNEIRGGDRDGLLRALLMKRR